MHIGLYFGSFNPIHLGHLIVAEYMLQHAPFDKIRFVVSPQNPFKTSAELIPENQRLEMVRQAVKTNAGFEVSDVEFSLPKPSFTIQTLNYFWEKEPENTFSLIMGSDNLEKLASWKEIETIAERCYFHVYRRHGSESQAPAIAGNFIIHEAPFIDISATYIRQLLANGKSLKYLVPDAVIPMLENK